MMDTEVIGIELVNELLDQIKPSKKKLSTTLRQQAFSVFKIMSGEIIYLKLNHDAKFVAAGKKKMKADILELKNGRVAELMAADLDEKRKIVVGIVNKELGDMLNLIDAELLK